MTRQKSAKNAKRELPKSRYTEGSKFQPGGRIISGPGQRRFFQRNKLKPIERGAARLIDEREKHERRSSLERAWNRPRRMSEQRTCSRSREGMEVQEANQKVENGGT